MMMNRTFNRRHSPNRRKTRLQAVVAADGATLEATILNVSYRGMRLELLVSLAPGTPVSISVLGHDIRAIVHWSKGGHTGVHLLDALDRDLLVAVETAQDDLAPYR
ncbi:MAG: PilZ domain-containing protein [Silicimonas sp.]|nr:PilZ domain-containing protein [Silicimonas sp.]MBT8424157.1 PilZ domain-containing protein [Silicimonas sp.]NND17088.1 PilZ domain-containing protein [Silicimonas sp.]NNL73892.1 PilZ domain-containing protein [Silicimonas sp.]RZW08649.1 MAG: PilZ domain-containing protein [Paracoccaceae bacterium]